MKSRINGLLLAALLSVVITAHLHAQTTEFTYQGQLTDSGQPASGIYDLRFAIFDSDSGGSPLAGPITNSPVNVSNGLFTTTLDFGTNVFTGPGRWLQIEVKTNGTAVWSELTPRQSLTPTPYAIHASNSGLADQAQTALGVSPGAVTATGILDSSVTAAKIADGQVVKSLNGLSDQVTLASGENLTLTTNGQTLTLATPADWHLGGNSGTIPGSDFIGTTDNQPLDFRVNNQRALRLEPNSSGAPNVIGGHPANFVTPGLAGVTISGGGSATEFHRVTAGGATIGGGVENHVDGIVGTVGGGQANTAASPGTTVSGGAGNLATNDYASVGGGQLNQAKGTRATVAGGANNVAGDIYTTVSGGQYNTATNWNATVGGGYLNVADGLMATVGGGSSGSALGDYATVAGGVANDARMFATFVGGGNDNDAIASAAAVCGGQYNKATGFYTFIGGGMDNRVDGRFSTISGGYSNVVSTGAEAAAIGGGLGNMAGAHYATVAGGRDNVAGGLGSFVGGGGWEWKYDGAAPNQALGMLSAVVGGSYNIAETAWCFVGGGYINAASNTYAAVCGGFFNIASGYASTVSGGSENIASGSETTVGGGIGNSATNSNATVPGGYGNTAGGRYSLAAGRQAKALHDGDFVWADSTDADFASTSSNQFLVRASGGVGINAPGPVMALDVRNSPDPADQTGDLHIGGINANGEPKLIHFGDLNSSGVGYVHLGENGQDDTLELRAARFYFKDGRVGIGITNPATLLHVQSVAGQPAQVRLGANGSADWDMEVPAANEPSLNFSHGGSTAMSVSYYGTVTATAFNPTSDRNAKENFTEVNPREVLEKVAAMPISRWNFKRDESAAHIGPMAQDFRAAFGLGMDEKHIATVDADGVALAAIQGLHQKVESENARLRAELKSRDARIAALQQRLDRLESRLLSPQETQLR